MMDDPSEQTEQDSITSDLAAVKIEVDKLWKAVNAIQGKFEFELPVKQSQTATLNEYKLKCAEYEDKIESLQQERTSLMEEIRILSKDQNVTTQQHSEPSDAWQTVRAKSHPDSSSAKISKQGKKKKNAQAQEPQNEGKNAKVNQQDTQTSRSNEETIIIGDSIIKGLRRDLLSQAAKRRVTVRSFPSATTTDMKHYLQLCVELNPKMIILHTGTNDLKSSTSPREVAEKIVDLGNMITSRSPDTQLTISSLTTRLDEDSLTKKVTDCNKVLRTFCNQNGWGFVKHPNIDESCLNDSKLHLNKKGIAVLASNLVNNIVH